MTEKYEFFPDHIKSQLPPLYSQENNKDPIVHIKFFCPWSQWTWYATEGQIEGEDFLFFGYVVGLEREWGYFALSEMESVTGPARLKIERDIYFKPQNASQIPDIHSHSSPNDAVQKQYCEYCAQDTPHEGKDCLACGKPASGLLASKEHRTTSNPANSESLAYKTCRVCGEQYDRPHKSQCSQRRNPPAPSA